MKRSFLLGLGIEKSVVDEIMQEHGASVELLKERHNEALNAVKEQNKQLKDKVDNASDVDSEALNSEITSLKEQINALKTEHAEQIASKQTEFETYKSSIENERTVSSKKNSIRKQLIADGVKDNDLILDALISKFDIDSVELDGNSIKDWGDLSKPIKEAHSDVFGTVTTQGVTPAEPPKGAGKAYSIDDVKKMSPQEINKNWDKVKDVLKQ